MHIAAMINHVFIYFFAQFPQSNLFMHWYGPKNFNAKCKCKFNVKHRECLRTHPSQRLMIKCLKFWFFEGSGKPEYPEKNLSEQGREPSTNSTNIAGSGNRTRDTLVGGERSHHCAIPAPRKMNF